MSTPALSVRQPWAELILRGDKRVELRSWHTHYRGPMWLHVGRKIDSGAAAHLGLGSLFTGGYVGTVTLAAVLRMDPDRWRQWAQWHRAGHYQPNMHGWLLADVVRFASPIPGPGRLKLFQPDAEITAALNSALEDAGAGQRP